MEGCEPPISGHQHVTSGTPQCWLGQIDVITSIETFNVTFLSTYNRHLIRREDTKHFQQDIASYRIFCTGGWEIVMKHA